MIVEKYAQAAIASKHNATLLNNAKNLGKGLLLLALNLRRRGFLVVYLGPNSTADGVHQVIDAIRPEIVCVSAATQPAAEKLKQLGEQCVERNVVSPLAHAHKAVFTFGGVAFTQNPELASNIPGIYLGNTINHAVSAVQDLVNINNEAIIC